VTLAEFRSGKRAIVNWLVILSPCLPGLAPLRRIRQAGAPSQKLREPRQRLLACGPPSDAASLHAPMQVPARRSVLTTQEIPMDLTITSPSTNYDPARSVGNEALSSYRERRAIEEFEREERRRANMAEVYASVNSADLRIRAWERAHQLRMPMDPLHPVLEAIAAATQLTLTEVREEQRLRSARRAPGAI